MGIINQPVFVPPHRRVKINQTTITNASVAHALNATFSDTEVEAALNALGTKVNTILTALKDAGIISPT